MIYLLNSFFDHFEGFTYWRQYKHLKPIINKKIKYVFETEDTGVQFSIVLGKEIKVGYAKYRVSRHINRPLDRFDLISANQNDQIFLEDAIQQENLSQEITMEDSKKIYSYAQANILIRIKTWDYSQKIDPKNILIKNEEFIS